MVYMCILYILRMCTEQRSHKRNYQLQNSILEALISLINTKSTPILRKLKFHTYSHVLVFYFKF